MHSKIKIYGDDANNTLTGGEKAEYFYAYGGEDLVQGGAGGDYLNGGEGSDTLDGGKGQDTLVDGDVDAEATDVLSGGGGDDLVVGGPGDTSMGGAGDDYIIGVGGEAGLLDGGSGADRVGFVFTSPDAYVGDFGFMAQQGDTVLEGVTLRGFESGSFRLGAGDDVVTLAKGLNAIAIDGGDGADRLTGTGQAEVLSGGNGDDTVIGGGGDDVLRSGAGHDLLQGGGGNDTLFAEDATTVMGGSGDDYLRGFGAGTLEGGEGNDTLEAWVGGELLKGGAGQDVYLFGYTFTQAGGSPADNPSTIMDADGMIVDLHYIDANVRDAMFAWGDQAFVVVDKFDKHGGELTLTYSATDDMTRVAGDLDGDKVADLVILIQGDHTDPAEYVL